MGEEENTLGKAAFFLSLKHVSTLVATFKRDGAVNELASPPSAPPGPQVPKPEAGLRSASFPCVARSPAPAPPRDRLGRLQNP